MTAPSERSRIRRQPKRAHYDLETIRAILADAWVCHVGIASEHGVRVIPTACWLWDDRLVIHGSTRSALLMSLAAGAEACVSVALIDGLVLARSAFHHSMNYRAVVLYGRAERLEGQALSEALDAFVERTEPGRSEKARRANDKELAVTLALAFDLKEASAKIRRGGPIDASADMELPVRAGIVPITRSYGALVPD